jgi:hypothetical protein
MSALNMRNIRVRTSARRDCGRHKSSESLLSASCNLQLSYAEDPSCHQHIALSTNRLRIEYDEHAERTYIAEIDEGPNIVASYTVAIQVALRKSATVRALRTLTYEHR